MVGLGSVVRLSMPPESCTARVLVVDDEPGVRNLVTGILRSHGYSVIEAGGAEEALQIAAREPQPIHLLLSDINMPGMDGPALAERLVHGRRVQKVLFISGCSPRPTLRVPARDSSFLAKPFRPAELLATVRRLLTSDTAALRTA